MRVAGDLDCPTTTTNIFGGTSHWSRAVDSEQNFRRTVGKLLHAGAIQYPTNRQRYLAAATILEDSEPVDAKTVVWMVLAALERTQRPAA